MFPISIREADIPTVVALSRQLPEFHDPPGPEEYEQRLTGVPHLILVAFVAGRPAGFKVGYQREDYFYSWMGGILPDHRRRGVARALAEQQETWARERGYREVRFKTRNQHKGMLIFALRNGFDMIGFRPKPDPIANRILLRKVL